MDHFETPLCVEAKEDFGAEDMKPFVVCAFLLLKVSNSLLHALPPHELKSDFHFDVFYKAFLTYSTLVALHRGSV